MNDHNEPLAVEIDDVRQSYYIGKMEVPTLHEIDLPVKRGEFIAIMRPSGSGKSTPMNRIGCLDRPTGGEIRVSGTDICRLLKPSLRISGAMRSDSCSRHSTLSPE